MDGKVLVLNSDYYPLHVCSIKRAITLSLKDKVEVLKKREDKYIASVTKVFPIPSIVRLKQYVKRRRSDIQLSRKNIHIRDKYTCQYCGKKVSDLTVDHIIPIKHGGKFTWENLVTCCHKCNNVKDSRTPEEANMRLLTIPKKPNHVVFLKIKYNNNYDWKEYLPN